MTGPSASRSPQRVRVGASRGAGPGPAGRRGCRRGSRSVTLPARGPLRPARSRAAPTGGRGLCRATVSPCPMPPSRPPARPAPEPDGLVDDAEPLSLRDGAAARILALRGRPSPSPRCGSTPCGVRPRRTPRACSTNKAFAVQAQPICTDAGEPDRRPAAGLRHPRRRRPGRGHRPRPTAYLDAMLVRLRADRPRRRPGRRRPHDPGVAGRLADLPRRPPGLRRRPSPTTPRPGSS